LRADHYDMLTARDGEDDDDDWRPLGKLADMDDLWAGSQFPECVCILQIEATMKWRNDK